MFAVEVYAAVRRFVFIEGNSRREAARVFGLLDTAAGFAAATIAGNVVTLQLGLTFLASAKGEAFEARAKVVKAGKVNLFVDVDLHAMRGSEATLVARANAVMAKLGG